MEVLRNGFLRGSRLGRVVTGGRGQRRLQRWGSTEGSKKVGLVNKKMEKQKQYKKVRECQDYILCLLIFCKTALIL